jgi:molecular chaperone IbpA
MPADRVTVADPPVNRMLLRRYDMNIDLTPYRRSAIGFDRLFDMLEASARQSTQDNYPPFNLERMAEDRYRITLAVAGFAREEITITAQQNLLLVQGKKEARQDNAAFLHVGIANRNFERKFELADFVRVESADLADGLLTIQLVREVPEAMKPRTISIGTGEPAAIEQVESKAA